MRISDWSSDVCSSDLAAQVADQRIGFGNGLVAEGLEARAGVGDRALQRLHRFIGGGERVAQIAHPRVDVAVDRPLGGGGELADLFGRSEEHTSELQSLIGISYVVF